MQVLYILLRFVVRYKTVYLWRHVPLAFFSLALPVFCYFQLSKAASESLLQLTTEGTIMAAISGELQQRLTCCL